MKKNNAKFTFENFVVSDCNSFAYSALRMVAENPGSVFNPLLIYGETGTGKTHLLKAAGLYFNEHNPELNTLFVDANEYKNEVIDSFMKSKLKRTRNKHRKADILIVDDVQDIASGETTQEEFLSLFKHLLSDDAQLIFAANTEPHEISGLHRGILSRFSSGMVAEIAPPDLNVRKAILQRILESQAVSVNREALERIVGMSAQNVFEVEGMAKKLVLYAKTNNTNSEDLTAEQIEELFGARDAR